MDQEEQTLEHRKIKKFYEDAFNKMDWKQLMQATFENSLGFIRQRHNDPTYKYR